MTKGSDVRLRRIILLTAILATAGGIIHSSLGEVILLHTQQPYLISDNMTLVAEDVDPQAGVVWLKLYSRNETLKSALLGAGGQFSYDHTNLTVNRIYVGGERDLVELKLNKSVGANRSEYAVSANSSTNISSNALLNSSAPSKAPEKSPA
jgi:hypothetical protein